MSRDSLLNKIVELHSKLFSCYYTATRLDFFFDKGYNYAPPEAHDNAIIEDKENKKNMKIIENKLSNILKELKVNNKKLYFEWIKLNIKTCDLIINNNDTDSTKVFVTKQIRKEWENISASEKLYVLPSVGYNVDYFKWFDKVFI